MEQLRPGEQVIAQHRSYRQCHRQRCQNGNDIRKCKRCKHSPFKAAQAKQRHKHQNNNQRGKHNRISDFARSFENNLDDRFRLGRLGVLLQPAKDVFHIHDGIVHQFPDGNRQPAERHGVDAQSKIVHSQDCGDERERNGSQTDERRAEIPQKQKQNDSHEDATFNQRPLYVANRPLDKVSLLESFGINRDIWGKGWFQAGQCCFNLAGDFEGIGVRLFLDGRHHGWLTVKAAVSTFECRADLNGCDIFDQYGYGLANGNH